ncbi:succinylglutamate desuccinylase/aspartoacylase family protein [Bacteroidota bacterium]
MKRHYKTLKILGQEILPGKSKLINLDVAKLHTRTSVEIPIFVERSKEDGPVLLLVAGIHGDEMNGVEIIRRIIKRKLNKPDVGTIICIPVFNIFGFLNLSREFPDKRDLNRVFPGSSRGSLASRFAYYFMKHIAPVVDYAIDFHTGSANRNNFPQVRCMWKDTKTRELALAFNAPFIVDSPFRAKTIRESLHKLGKSTLLYEGGTSLSFDETVINTGINGTLNVMHYLGIKNVKRQDIQSENPIFIVKSKWIRTPYSGMFHSTVQNGLKVRKNEILGTITDPYGSFERYLKSPLDGYLIAVSGAPIVHQGDAIYHLGIEKEEI